MGARMKSLTFRKLKVANMLRDDKHWHEMEIWSATDWACAIAGEIGEACNLIKKARRNKNIYASEIVEELADAVIYIDILAQHYGFDLGEAIRRKFNKVSEREGCDVKL
jgi:NTP pyrophosphatase (non-canonical NTP hydrolase)